MRRTVTVVEIVSRLFWVAIKTRRKTAVKLERLYAAEILDPGRLPTTVAIAI